tara:strand:- start:7965 stop:9242 length:1278 start_codon:yes stop_codon:yes gene_type:complete
LILQIATARVFQPLLQPSRYKGAFGGRGSGKSHFFADEIVEQAVRQPGLRVVCIREIQKTLKQSAKKLIEDKIIRHGLSSEFKVLTDCIETPGNGIIIFQGMQDHTADSIKSLEGFDIAWVEEAQTLSETSLKLLRPTIRKEGSEIWFSWNPRRKSDPVDKLLRQGKIPTSSIVVSANWEDNPWFPNVLEQERLDCLDAEPDEYDHIWDGGYEVVTKGAYFAKRIKEARKENRIGRVNPDPLMTYQLFADIGGTGAKADNFVFWVAQFIGIEIRVVDHYEVQGQDVAYHLNWMREQGYTPSNTKIWLPHDGSTNDRVNNVSYESAFCRAAYKVEVVPNQGTGAAKKRIDEVRRLFPSIYINENTCSAGLIALGAYHEKWDDKRDVGLGPEHDWSSHSADAFGLMCVAYRPAKKWGSLNYQRQSVA